MARLSFDWGRVQTQTKANSLYLIIALVVFGGVIFLLFRGHAAGPQDVAADTPPEAGSPVQPASNPTYIAESQPEPAAPASESSQPPLAFMASASVANVPVIDSQPNPAAAEALAQALALRQSQPGRIIEVRDKLNGALKMPMSAEQRQAIKDEMAKLAEEWLFGPAPFASDKLCETYMVKRNERLGVIGQRYKVPHEALMQINNIPRPESLQAGRAIKVPNGPFHVKVYRSTFTVDLYLQDTYVRSFKVGLGKPGYETPTGLWRVQEGGKLVQPPWTDPDSGRLYKKTDPDYPLGSRWMALEGMEGAAKGRTGFAIHGTKDPDQIGTAGSRGCIRMYNGDVILLYNLLIPVYSTVEVLD